MHIAVVATSGIYPIHIGGPASVGYFLAREFGKLGHPTTLFVRARDQKELQMMNNMELEMQNVKIKPIKINYNIKTFINTPLLAYKILKFTKLFNRGSFDVILYNSPPVDVALFLPILSKLNKSKQILIFHGYGGLYDSKYIPHRVGRLLIKIQKEWFDKAITVSNFSKEIPLFFGFEAKEIEVIPNGVDLDIIEAVEPLNLPGYPKILFVGPLSQIKGVDTILRVFSIIIEKFPDAHLYLVGDGPERSNLEKLSNSLDVMNNVHFEGFHTPGIDTYSYYKSCDLLIMASHREGFPMAIIEAMASGLPCIVSDIPSFGIVEDAKCGLMLNFTNIRKAAEEIIEYLEMNNLDNHSKNAREYVVNTFEWRLIAERYLKEFKKVVVSYKL